MNDLYIQEMDIMAPEVRIGEVSPYFPLFVEKKM